MTTHIYRPFGATAMLARCRTCGRDHGAQGVFPGAPAYVPGFRDSRGLREMWRAASFSERVLVLGAPALLVLAVVVGGAA